MNLPKHLFILWGLFFSFPYTSFAQFDIEDFKLSGTAQKISEQCIRLAPDFQYVSGSAWYEKPIDLSAPFQMEVCLVFGEKDLDGADGIVFVFYPRLANTGSWGEGMGFRGLRPSLGIEFDTYRNYHLADPEEDHIAVMGNGQTHHYSSLVKPVLVGNLEDGQPYVMRITWDPGPNVLQVFLDNDLKVAFNADIVNGIFGGNPIVYWGVTAATGRLSNNHEICIKKLLFTDAGDEVGLPEGLQFKPGSARFTVDSHAKMDELYRYLAADSTRLVAIQGHTGENDANSYNRQLSDRRVRAVVDFLLLKGIAADRILTQEEQKKYQLAFDESLSKEKGIGAIVFVPE